jgi:hypothetical protein
MNKILSVILFVVLTINIPAQTKVEYFPALLNIQPFTANSFEPKLGFLFQTDKNDLRLDIGNSMDIALISLNEKTRFSFGADFFTYTLLRRESNFHFPVDAVDYLFGINASLKITEHSRSFGVRFRLSHISAHFVDGHYDGTNQRWKDGLNPIVYSREFIELMPFYQVNDLRIYAGFTYLINVDPSNLGKDSYQLGFDYFASKIINEHITPFIGYDIKLVNLNNYTANNSVQAGIKFGNPSGKGFSIYFEYYSGKSVHGEYYNFNNNYSALGFNLNM